MPLSRPRPLCILLLVLALTALPQALLAAPRSEAPESQVPSLSALLPSFWNWLGFASTETRCGADPNGGQQCNPSSGSDQRPTTQHVRVLSSRPTSSNKALSGSNVRTDTRCGLDPDGVVQCTDGSRRPTWSGGTVGTDTRCTADPDGGLKCAAGSSIQPPTLRQ